MSNIKENYIWVTLECTVNGTLALAPERKSSGSLGIVEIGKQFFVPPAQQHSDIVFTAKMYKTEHSPECMDFCSATLRTSTMLDVAKMAGVVKNIAFKPANGMVLRLHLDTHALFDQDHQIEDISRTERYERLQNSLLKKAVRSGTSHTPSPIATPPSSPPTRIRKLSPAGQIRKPLPKTPDPDTELDAPTTDSPSLPPSSKGPAGPAPVDFCGTVNSPVDGLVLRVFASIGGGLLYGAPVCEIEELEHSVSPSPSPRGRSSSYTADASMYGAQSAYGKEDRSLYEASSAAYGASSDAYGASRYGVESNAYGRESSGTGLGSPRLSGAVATGLSSSRSGRKLVITWTNKDPAVVTGIHVEKGGILKAGGIIVTVDLSRF